MGRQVERGHSGRGLRDLGGKLGVDRQGRSVRQGNPDRLTIVRGVRLGRFVRADHSARRLGTGPSGRHRKAGRSGRAAIVHRLGGLRGHGPVVLVPVGQGRRVRVNSGLGLRIGRSARLGQVGQKAGQMARLGLLLAGVRRRHGVPSLLTAMLRGSFGHGLRVDSMLPSLRRAAATANPLGSWGRMVNRASRNVIVIPSLARTRAGRSPKGRRTSSSAQGGM